MIRDEVLVEEFLSTGGNREAKKPCDGGCRPWEGNNTGGGLEATLGVDNLANRGRLRRKAVVSIALAHAREARA